MYASCLPTLRRLFAAAALCLPSMGALAGDDDLRALTEEARKASLQLLTQIRGEVVKEMERTGPIRAVVVCKYSAPELTSTLSRQTGMRVTRVALRVRNRALGEADPWEQRALLEFEKRLAGGEKVESLEAAEIVHEPAGRMFRYVKAIPMGQPCLACHGPVSAMSEAVKAQIASEYPHDKAVDFQVGQIRGAVSVKSPSDRRLLLRRLAILPLAGMFWACGEDRPAAPVGELLPDLSFSDLDGHPHRFADLRGQPALINVWASWCPPCRAEMAGLEALHRSLARRVRVVGISADGDLNLAREYLRQAGLTFPVWSDPGGKIMDGLLKTPAIPVSLLVAGDGRIRRLVIGEQDWEISPARAWVEALVG